ncbi:hypothetical protein Cgig2_013783 [Carnegiea gigantea]|uniref:RNase H type-1 domain-containing protein n=1 Tax=Carnegiea gigantea TaxID=171969 RepID=A0A9Q1K9D7_9CARY|nr:hypothetical protein Cgig2_013783 [Carnegiea gigantea]
MVKPENPQVTKVSSLLDYASTTWREELVRGIFIPYDAELILSLPLCDQWPQDKLIWHYTANGVFSVKSTYHLINARNRFIFRTLDKNLGVLSRRATSFVRSYRASLEHDQTIGDLAPSLWQLPALGTYKLDFDGGCVGKRGWGWGWGWGFVIRNSNDNVVMAGVQQGMGFAGPEVEEARACTFGLKKATAARLANLVIEGDCLSLIQKLKNKQVPNNVLGSP